MNGSMNTKRRWHLDEGDGTSVRVRVASFWALPLAATLLSLVLGTGVICGFELMIGFSINGWEVVLATLVSFAGLAVWMGRIHGRRWLSPWVALVVAVVLVIVPNLVLCGRVLDSSWDGQWFHQEAVIQFAEGWNPFRAELGASEVPFEETRIRLNGYPKATWLWGASLYRLTHRIERAKSFSFPLMIAALLSVLAVLLLVTSLRPLTATAVAVVAAANPMALIQMLNAYQDGAMASLLTICGASLALWVLGGSRVGLVMATASAVGVSAIKLTGPIFVAVFVIAAVGWLVWFGRWRGERRVFGLSLLAAAAGLMLLSGGSYLSNTIRHGHSLYPILGPDRATILNAPPHSRFQGLLASVLSRSSSTSDDNESVAVLQEWARLKPPFTFDRREVAAFFSPRVRIGGWGPLFGGVVLLTVVLFGLSALRRPKWAGVVLLAVAPVVLSVLLINACWKFRYVPQSWCIPLIIAVLVLTRSPSGLERILAGALVITAGLNSALVAGGHFPAVMAHSVDVKHRLLDLQQRHRTLEVDFFPFRSNRVRLTELGIDFTEIDDRRYNLPVYLGTAPSAITHLEVFDSAGGGRTAVVGWSPSYGVGEYRIEVLDQRPVGPGGGALSLLEKRTSELRAVLPLPSKPVTLLMTTCNALGCGAGYTLGEVDAGGSGRFAPVMGVPGEDAVVTDPAVVFSWVPAAPTPGGGSSRYLFRLEDAQSGELVIENETAELWVGHRFATDGEWWARVGLAGAAPDEMSSVCFRTVGVAAPRITAPVSGFVMAEGPVELEWEEVAGATAYEVFVAVEGRSEPVHRSVVTMNSARVDLTLKNGVETRFSVIVRACFDDRGFKPGKAYGWGPWTIEAGLGDVKIVVRPALQEESSNLGRGDAGG